MPFDIRQLRYAIAAADHASFYRTARALDVERSMLRRNTLRLEEVIGANVVNADADHLLVKSVPCRFWR